MLRPQSSCSPVLAVLAAALAFLGADLATWTPPLAAQETSSTDSTPSLGALEEGLQKLADGELDLAQQILERAEAPGLERAQWLLAELTGYYRLNESFEAQRVTTTEGGVTFHTSRSGSQGPTLEELQEARNLIRSLAAQEAPSPDEVRAVTAWTRGRIEARGNKTPKLVRMLHCHVGMLVDEADEAAPSDGEAQPGDEETPGQGGKTQVETFPGGSVRSPVRVFDPRPGYTPVARKARVQGVVITQATLDADGCVQDLTILKGLPLGLSESVLETAPWWVFKPARLKGEPVAVYYNFTMNFTLQ